MVGSIRNSDEAGASMPPLSLLVARSLLALLEKEIPKQLEKVLSSLERRGRLKRYPDGSLLIEGMQNLEEFQRTYQQYGAGELSAGDAFRALAPFPACRYGLIFPSEYYESMMPVPFLAGLSDINEPVASESNLANLAVTVGFRRRLSRDTMGLYTEMVADWLASVKSAGMFGEGPILPIEPAEVTFQNPRAQFRVDARLSGQNSLNWFTLNALQFGIDVAAIHIVLFDSEENLDARIPVSTGKIAKLPIPSRPSHVGSPPTQADAAEALSVRIAAPEEEKGPPHLPGDCAVYTAVHSELPLFVRPCFEWDALTVSIYFDRFPTSEEQQSFRKLIESWGMIGSYGGLGGQGIHHLHAVAFDPKSESASFYVDMGDTDEPAATSLLIRVLEGFAQYLPIEAVVFGRGIEDGVWSKN